MLSETGRQPQKSENKEMTKLYIKAQHLVEAFKDECGQDSVEYAIMIGIVALAAITSVGTISNYVKATFANYAASL
jgi:Flp pilus assembly pilin Flp